MRGLGKLSVGLQGEIDSKIIKTNLDDCERSSTIASALDTWRNRKATCAVYSNFTWKKVMEVIRQHYEFYANNLGKLLESTAHNLVIIPVSNLKPSFIKSFQHLHNDKNSNQRPPQKAYLEKLLPKLKNHKCHKMGWWSTCKNCLCLLYGWKLHAGNNRHRDGRAGSPARKENYAGFHGLGWEWKQIAFASFFIVFLFWAVSSNSHSKQHSFGLPFITITSCMLRIVSEKIALPTKAAWNKLQPRPMKSRFLLRKTLTKLRIISSPKLYFQCTMINYVCERSGPSYPQESTSIYIDRTAKILASYQTIS